MENPLQQKLSVHTLQFIVTSVQTTILPSQTGQYVRSVDVSCLVCLFIRTVHLDLTCQIWPASPDQGGAAHDPTLPLSSL